MKAETFKSLGTTKQLAYINRLENINKQKQALLDAMDNQWVSVRDRLPKEGQDVLCCADFKKTKEWFYGCCKYASFGFPWTQFNNTDPIEYWRTIPEPPKE